MVTYKQVRHEADAWTVGRLRAALAELPDDLPIEIDVPDAPGDKDSAGEYVVIGAGFGRIDTGDGQGLRVDEGRLCVTADFPSGTYEQALED